MRKNLEYFILFYFLKQKKGLPPKKTIMYPTMSIKDESSELAIEEVVVKERSPSPRLCMLPGSSERDKEIIVLTETMNRFRSEGQRMESVAEKQYSLRLASDAMNEKLKQQITGLKIELQKRPSDRVDRLPSRSLSPQAKGERRVAADIKRHRRELLETQKKLQHYTQEVSRMKQTIENMKLTHQQELVAARSARVTESDIRLQDLRKSNSKLKSVIIKTLENSTTSISASPSDNLSNLVLLLVNEVEQLREGRSPRQASISPLPRSLEIGSLATPPPLQQDEEEEADRMMDVLHQQLEASLSARAISRSPSFVSHSHSYSTRSPPKPVRQITRSNSSLPPWVDPYQCPSWSGSH